MRSWIEFAALYMLIQRELELLLSHECPAERVAPSTDHRGPNLRRISPALRSQ